MMMLHNLTTPLHPSVTNPVV